MAEALGLTASVAAVLQITSSVISVCHDYSSAAQGALWEVPSVRTGLEKLREVLQILEPLAEQAESGSSSRGARLPTLKPLCGRGGLLQTCLDIVTRLDHRLKTPGWSQRFGPKRKALVQALRWPLKEAETKKTLQIVDRFKGILEMAIVADQTRLIMAIQDIGLSTNDVTLEIQEDVRTTKVTGLKTDENVRWVKKWTHRQAIHRWLCAPDPSTNYIRACRTREAQTGSWFLDSEAFTRWKMQRPLLWLHGKAGCSKTVLCSTIIAKLLQERNINSKMAVAYFYFDFNDLEKQKSDNMMRSLITQLSAQSTKHLKQLESLFLSCNNGERQPDSQRLPLVLKDIIEVSDKIYIIIDALDECSNTQELQEHIEEIQRWGLPQLHMLLTSRRLMDIEEMIDPLTDAEDRICIQSALVDADIQTYVHERLQNDRRFKRWRSRPHVQEEIKMELMKKADGMFRWAVCQLETLQHCLNLPVLRKALNSLPKTLDDTYARILCNIPEDHSQHAIRILQWLTCSERPLRINELAETVAVNVDGNPWFQEEERFPEPQEILKICSSLVIVENGSRNLDDQTAGESEYDRDDESVAERDGKIPSTVRLAHFSVKEYLVSKRIQRNKAVAKYAIQETSAHESIAAVCLAYLLQFDQYDSLTLGIDEEFPLALYAANYWTQHARKLGENLNSVQMLGHELCLVQKEAYVNWLRLEDVFLNMKTDPSFQSAEFPTPLYSMSLGGVSGMVRYLIDLGADVNHHGRTYGSALQAASHRGHESVVQLLLSGGADVNAKSGDFSNPLLAASFAGNEAVVRLLLKWGADVNVRVRNLRSALQGASDRSRDAVLEVFEAHESGADHID